LGGHRGILRPGGQMMWRQANRIDQRCVEDNVRR
jgi:hypothetical protein